MPTPMTKVLFLICAAIMLFSGMGHADGALALRGLDRDTGELLPEAMVTLDGAALAAGPEGLFPLPQAAGIVRGRAHGYQRAELPIAERFGAGPIEVKLSPLAPRALYLTFYGVGSNALRGPALRLIEETELNALVIDVKGDRGMIPYRSSVALASEIGAQKIITVRDAEGLFASFKEKDISTIARIVVFKDDLLARARAERLAAYLRGRSIAGVDFEAARFTPSAGIFKGEECRGVRIELKDRNALKPVAMGIELLTALNRLFPGVFRLDPALHLVGSRAVLQAIADGLAPESIVASWQPQLDDFRRRSTPFLLY